MNLLYFVTGNQINIHSQCYFSILSFFSQGGIQNVHVYTDFPEFYHHFDNRLKVITLTQDQIKEWKGHYNNFFRIKIKLMEDYCHRQEIIQPFMYLDTDTFAYKPIDKIITNLQVSKAFMHVRECRMAELTYSGRRMFKQICNRTFSDITVTNQHYVWNAGLIALPINKQAEIINQILNVCDEINSITNHWLIEQCSVSLTLNQHFDIQPAESMVGHYWSAKSEWKSVIADFFLYAYMNKLTIDESLEQMKNFDFRKAPVSKYTNNTQKRLSARITKWFPDKHQIWIND